MNITEKRTRMIQTFLADKHNAKLAESYGEPGYSLEPDQQGIVFANWDDISQTLQDYLKEAGFELEWSDEWLVHYDYGSSKAYRTQPDSYDWQPSFCITEDGEMLTRDDDISDWIYEYQMTDYGQPIKALPNWIDSDQIIAEGFELLEETYESGFHYGQDADPAEIAEKLFTENNLESLVFQVAGKGQFDIRFQVYIKKQAD